MLESCFVTRHLKLVCGNYIQYNIGYHHFQCMHIHTHNYSHALWHTHTHTQMLKLLSVGTADPPCDQASYYTSLAVVGCALKYLPTSHTSEPDIHEQAIALQVTTASQLLPHIQKSLSALMATESTIEVHIEQSLALYDPHIY